MAWTRSSSWAAKTASRHPRPAAPAEPEPEEDFSLHLEAAPEPEPTTSGELDDLIRRAMAGIPDEADEDSVGEIRLDVEAQRAPVQPAPQPDPMGTRDVIPHHRRQL